MTGAEILLETLVSNGIEFCFMNPGTSEMHFVAALDRVHGCRGVLCLFEGVCAGAADGYARMTGKPAAILTHLGPGLGNALSNLHNARKARVPVVSIVGEHTRSHLTYDAPLSADVGAFAKPVSEFVRTAKGPDDIAQAASETIAAAMAAPGQVATLIIPADLSWSEARSAGPVVSADAPKAVEMETIRSAATLLTGDRAGILLGGKSLNDRAFEAAARIAESTGVRIFMDRYAPKLPSGSGRFQPHRIPYFPEAALPLLANLDHMILVESQAPVTFFGYPNSPSYLLPEHCKVFSLADRTEDGTCAMERLALFAAGSSNPGHSPPFAGSANAPARVAFEDSDPISAAVLGITIADLLPENTIVSDEMISMGPQVLPYLLTARKHDQLPVTGGSIGQGLPVALGAALACPDRKVLALEADGSGMYTPQTLWTIAREQLDVVTVILANRRYRILDVEMKRTGAHGYGPRAEEMISIGRPDIDWVKLSESMGVPAIRVETAGEFAAEFRRAMGTRGARLIEAVIA
ncbi:MAG: acetolactate synthase large subunit [Bryobacteraceae bacterium]